MNMKVRRRPARVLSPPLTIYDNGEDKLYRPGLEAFEDEEENVE